MASEIAALAVPRLLQLQELFDAVPYEWALIGHCLYCASQLAPDLRAYPLLHVLLTFLGGFGGGMLSSVLIMVRTYGIFVDI